MIEARFALRRAQQAIFRALAPAIGEKFALPAIRRQRLGFRIRELDLRRREHHVAERALPDVAQPIPGIDVVVAGVDAAVVLEGDPLAAELLWMQTCDGSPMCWTTSVSQKLTSTRPRRSRAVRRFLTRR
jgi:hypothetical protein